MSEWIRQECQFCGSRTGMAINLKTDGFFCHSCQAKGKRSESGMTFKEPDAHAPKTRKSPDVLNIWTKLHNPGVFTRFYLASRGIHAYGDLPLKEGSIWVHDADLKKAVEAQVVAAYGFYNIDGMFKAFHYTQHLPDGRVKRYKGPKSEGFAMLKDSSKPIIVAEGLENALIVRQEKFDAHYGILVGGDCGNLKKYCRDYNELWATREFIYVQDNDPAGEEARRIFCKTFNVIETITTAPGRDAVDIWGKS